MNIPPGAKYVSSSDGGAVAVTGTQVQWALDSLEAGADRALVVKYQLGMPGTLLLDVHGSADDELTAAAQATTNVEAVADVRLEVKEPEGPVPVGEDAAYELHVKNRGTKGAQAIEVYGYFSQGIEPTSADGATYRLSPGQVTFSPIPTLAAGQEVMLKVHSRAATAGNHVFRAEVHCKVRARGW